MCKSFGPFDARCICLDTCPSYEEPLCSSNGTTYDNECLFQQDMCFLKLNFTVQHPGSCEGMELPFVVGATVAVVVAAAAAAAAAVVAATAVVVSAAAAAAAAVVVVVVNVVVAAAAAAVTVS